METKVHKIITSFSQGEVSKVKACVWSGDAVNDTIEFHVEDGVATPLHIDVDLTESGMELYKKAEKKVSQVHGVTEVKPLAAVYERAIEA